MPETFTVNSTLVHNGTAEESFVQRIVNFRKKLSLSQEGLAKLLGISVRTVSRWEMGAVPRMSAARLFIRIEQLIARLPSDLSDPNEIIRWLSTPQPAHCSPMELLMIGDTDQVLKYMTRTGMSILRSITQI